jgi:hypothetical protein
MKRRQFVVGLGAIAAGGAAIGTGAFTSTEADRSVSVSVADEDQAYLALSPTQADNATFATQDSGTNNQIAIDINDAAGTEKNGEGVGLHSVYEFDNVFQVENQGTQEVEVTISELSDSDFDPDATGLTVQFYPGTDAGSPLHDTPVTLGTGKSRSIGIKVETADPDIDHFSADATVSAEST